MNGKNRASLSNAEDRFAEAVTRLESGETIAAILATYPPDTRDELASMLTVVESARSLRQTPIPRPSAARRAAAKQTFLATAAAMRAEQTARAPVAPAASRRPTTLRSIERTARRRSARPQSLMMRFAARWQSIFNARMMRLAPIIVTLALVLFSTGTLVTMAQNSVPGDLTYTLKQWIRRQELVLAPAAQRDLVRQAQERELAADVAKAAERADANSAVIQAEDTQIYYGRTGRILKIGGLSVLDRYQPDANVEVFKDMTIEGDLDPGAQVHLEYQILPGQSATVQGIALTVVAPPDPELLDASTPTVEIPAAGACTVTPPEDWVPYEVAAGDNLTFMATRGGTTVEKLMAVNCLDSEVVVIGQRLFVPADSLNRDQAPPRCGTPIPTDWVVYEVQPGDSLSVIADRTGVSVDELMGVNCLDSETILIGAQLYVPPTQ